MKYKLALFDFDGTLADSAEWFLKCLNGLADEFRLRRIDPADYEKVRGYSSEQVLEYLGLPLWKLPLWMRRMRQAAAQDAGQIKLFPGVPGMLRELRGSGVSTGIVSSNSELNVRKILGEHVEHIQQFACGASLFGKASKLRTALKKSQVTASESIYIGDEIRDAAAARKAGIHFAAVTWGFAAPDALRAQKPDAELNSIDEILRFFQQTAL